MAVARFASAKPAAGVAPLLYTVARTALTSIVAVNTSGFTKISAWIVLSGALSRTATGTAGSSQITINDPTSVTVGMLAIGSGIAPKTLVTKVTGNVLDLSLPLTDSLSSTAVSVGDWIPYVDNVELTNRNTFETFRIAVNVGDEIYVSSQSGEVTFFINGVYDLTSTTNITVGEQEPESPQIGDIWIRNDLDPAAVTFWDGTEWQELGSVGPAGPPNDLTIGTVETGEFGDPAEVTITGTSPEQTLNFVLPPGQQGPATTLTVGTVTASDPGEDAEVEITGTSPDQTINFVLPRGEVGPMGPAGLPDQQDNAGKYLTTDGTDPFWEDVDALPSQTGNEGKYLTTDGTDPEWAFLSGGSAADEPPATGLVDGSIWLDTDGEIQAPSGRLVRWIKAATAGQTTFSGASDGTEITLNYNPSSEQVFLNGVQLVRGSDYTGSDGTEIVLSDPASVGDILQVITLPFIIASSNLLSEEKFTGRGAILTAVDSGQSLALDLGTDGQVLTVNTETTTGLEWSTPDAFPSQTSNAGKFLSTSGTEVSWQEINLEVIEDNLVLNLMGAI
jgi:hypothetical protein